MESGRVISGASLGVLTGISVWAQSGLRAGLVVGLVATVALPAFERYLTLKK